MNMDAYIKGNTFYSSEQSTFLQGLETKSSLRHPSISVEVLSQKMAGIKILISFQKFISLKH